MFEVINIRHKRGPLFIGEKRWYFCLVDKKNNFGMPLMKDYSLAHIQDHLVVCYTPEYLPDQTKPFLTKKGKQGRIYAFFDSYLEYFHYMNKFKEVDRNFYEIVFGELPQKPHFDIDLDISDDEDKGQSDKQCEELKDAVIESIIETLKEVNIIINISEDVMIFFSHGINKRSYHIIITNWCHDNNKEAEAFYNKVMEKVHIKTNNKYVGKNVVDPGVYNLRQQFRIYGSQKTGSNRPKRFLERFLYKGEWYDHKYPETVDNPEMKRLVVLYQSLIGFVGGCEYIPSLIPPEQFAKYFKLKGNGNNGIEDIMDDDVKQCMDLVNGPFSYKETVGNIIVLNREGPSYCTICETMHENQHPYLLVFGSKVYFDCRRAFDHGKGKKKLFLGYINITSYQDLIKNNTKNYGIIDAMNNIQNPQIKEEEEKSPIQEHQEIIKQAIDIPIEYRQQTPNKLESIINEQNKKKKEKREKKQEIPPGILKIKDVPEDLQKYNMWSPKHN